MRVDVGISPYDINWGVMEDVGTPLWGVRNKGCIYRDTRGRVSLRILTGVR